MSNDTQNLRPLAHLRQADDTDETVTYLHGRRTAGDDLYDAVLEELRITDFQMGRPTALAITYADSGDLPDQYADIQRQVGAGIEQLRAWYPNAFIKVAPVFTFYAGKVSLKWEVCAIPNGMILDGTGKHPHSYECSTLAEALAEMRQQMRRYADLETVNAQLQDAAFEEALWCHEAVAFDWNDTQH